ncbi:MAG: membrane protein insertion efficiency factor YidD [Candidatus Rokuibacteriota bacterium]
MLMALRAYQRGLSPLLPPACRYWPSCSEYARRAIARRGLVRGGMAALWRLVRCQPLFAGGIERRR